MENLRQVFSNVDNEYFSYSNKINILYSIKQNYNMKTIYILSSFLIILLQACGQKHNSLQELKIKGKVFKVIEKYYEIKNEKDSSQTLQEKMMYRFDEKGNLTTQNTLSPKEELISQIEMVYDDDTQFPLKNFVYDHEKNLVEENIFKTNRSGHIIEQKKYDAGKHLLQDIIFERQGQKILQYKIYGANKKLLMQFVNQYEGQDIQEVLRFDAQEKLQGSNTYRYDLDRNLVEERILDAEKNVQKQREFQYENYDKKGNWTYQKTIENGTYNKLLVREIIYYEK